jgi:hypothetical protein
MPGHGARQADTVTPCPDAAMAPRRIVVGVSGATGIVYATRLLEALRQAGTETHLVVTPAAGMTRPVPPLGRGGLRAARRVSRGCTRSQAADRAIPYREVTVLVVTGGAGHVGVSRQVIRQA